MRRIKYAVLAFLILNTAQAKDLSKSATFNYLKNWYNLTEAKITALKQYQQDQIEKLKKDLSWYEPSDPDAIRIKGEIERIERQSSIFDEPSDIIKELKRLGPQGDISDSFLTKVVKNFLSSQSALELYKNKIDESLPLINKLINREADFANDYYVFYSSYDKENEKNYIDKCLERGLERISSDHCLKTKELTYIEDLKNMKYKTLKELFDKYLFTTEFKSDHDAELKNYLGSYNLSLFGNTSNAESTLERFFKDPQKIILDMSKYKNVNPPIITKLRALEAQKYPVLNQIFVRKNIAPELGYISFPFGYPLYNSFQALEEETKKTLNNFQIGKYEEIKESNKFVISQKQVDSMVPNERSRPAKDYFSVKPWDIQFRMMYIPELFNQPGTVKIFDNIKVP